MEKYTVALFGHRNMSTFPVNELYDTIKELLETHEYVEFLIGREGGFDNQAATVIRNLMEAYENCSLTLVLPYPKAEYITHRDFYLTRYTSIEICEASAKVHYKDAYSVRNRNMADRADMIICGIEHESGGAWNAVKYAEAKHKKIRNMCQLDTQK